MLSVYSTGSAEGQGPFAGGAGVSPVFGFITPFLARKGAGGMVEGLWGTNATLAGQRLVRLCRSEQLDELDAREREGRDDGAGDHDAGGNRQEAAGERHAERPDRQAAGPRAGQG